MPRHKKDKEIIFRNPNGNSKELRANSKVFKKMQGPEVVMHTNRLVQEELEKFKSEQSQYEPRVVVHEGRSEEEQILELARQGLSDIKDVAQVAGPGIVVRLFISALKIGAAGAIGLDAVMGALNNTFQERDFEAPPTNSSTGGASRPK
jgi:hypothetical protein